MTKKKKGKQLTTEVQTRNLPPDLFDINGEELDEDYEWEEKIRKVRRVNERYFDDE